MIKVYPALYSKEGENGNFRSPLPDLGPSHAGALFFALSFQVVRLR